MTSKRHILVIANETVESDLLSETIRASVGDGRDTAVLVVAPALIGRVRHWASDDDRARRAAAERVRRSVERLVAAGIHANGAVGDADPVQAAADALRTFPADELIVATHPEGRSSWLTRDVVRRACERFDLPVLHIVAEESDRRTSLAGHRRLAESA